MSQGACLPGSSPDERKPILIVAAGKTFPQIREVLGDFDDWIASGLGTAHPQQRVDARQGTPLPEPGTLAAVVVSGSHAMVSHREPWSEQLAQWMKRCVEAQVPVLGICYGHQLLAHAFGGLVDDLPGGPEVGTHSIRLAPGAREDALLAGLPQRFPAQLVHYQSVLRLPDKAVLLACSDLEPHQAFRIGGCGWGVQFHPEFSAPAMQAYVEHANGSRDTASQLHAPVSATPDAGSLLARFAALARGPGSPAQGA
jgi:GMP synthase (glutamine-hydrolysing)